MNGLLLNHLFYEEIVAPLLKSHSPDLRYSAALIGWGSDVLGYDDLQSTDHNWGVRFQLFLTEQDFEKRRKVMHDILDAHLPADFRGYSVAFEMKVNEDQQSESGSLKHNIEVGTIGQYFSRYLGCDPHGELKAADWLTFSEHKLLAVTSGKVFYDGLNELEPIRRKFQYYPRDVWLYLLAAQWEKISEQEAFVGRCGYVGDELGSMLIAAWQVKNLMRLCFLMEQKYAPYSKWFGTAFNRLPCAAELSPIFMRVLQSQDWKTRQEFLAQAYEVVARLHNSLGITIPLNEKAAPYYDRPYLVIGDGRYGEELRKSIASEAVRKIKYNIGSLNEFVDSDDKLNDMDLCKNLKGLFQ
jgi:Domain of unknown function (DUF4037)